MARTARSLPSTLALLGGLLLGATGCDSSSYGVTVTGLLSSTEADLTQYGDTVILRAVPDHIDGFSPDNPYTGQRVISASCPLEHTEIPLDFLMIGDPDVLDRAPPRWLLLAWIGEDEDETWIQPGQLYGSTTFAFDEVDHHAPWADSVQIEMSEVYGGLPTRAGPR